MNSNEGLLGAFKDLGDIEGSVRDVYEELLGKLTDRELADFMMWLIKAEERHKVLIEEALELIEK